MSLSDSKPAARLAAQTAATASGAAELPNLLRGDAVRPGWQVAGVDYAVGVPGGAALKNPAAINMPGVSVNGRTIAVSGGNVTLSGYDFSANGGYTVVIEGGASNVTIANSKFAGGSGQFNIQITPGASNVTVTGCTFAGGGASAQIFDQGSGTFIAKDNFFTNSPEDAIDFSGGNVTPTVENNLFENLGTSSGAHPDAVQFYGGTVRNALIADNTIYQPDASGMEGVQVDAQGGATISNTTVRNNVIVAAGPGIDMSYSIAIQQQSGSNNGVEVADNYIDTTGAYGAFYPPGGSNISFSGNVNLKTGKVFANPPGTSVDPVVSVAVSPAKGVVDVGATLTFTVHMSGVVRVHGTPTLILNDGGHATYRSGSGSNTLTFTYTVRGSDHSVGTLAITGLGLPNGAGITDTSGAEANMAGVVKSFSGLSIDPPSGYRDGGSGAPAGTPQLPNILKGYAARPPWQVAGVDYAVGVPAGTTLKDPTAAGVLPAGASYDAATHTVTVSGNNVTLSGFDFSLHGGVALTVAASNVTVKNCKFVVGPNQGGLGRVVNVTPSAGNVTFLDNEFNGNNAAVTPQQGSLLSVENHGTITFEYNYFHNTGGDCIDFTGGPQTENVEYNAFANIGVNTAHADTLQWYDTQVVGGEIGFNTIYQNVPQPGPGNGALTVLSEGPSSTMTNMMVNNDTVIQAVSGTGNFTTGFYADMGGTASNVAFRDLYIDPTGAVNYTGMWLFPTGYYGDNLAHPTAVTNVTNMVTGKTYTGLPSAQGYYVAPDASGYTLSLNDIYRITASPGSGIQYPGATITFTMTLDCAYTVQGTPTLSLNNGAVATYSGGSGSNTLTFKYTVKSTDQTVSTLAVTGVNLPNGASLTDAMGNHANVAGEHVTFNGLGVDPPCFCRGTHIAVPGGEALVEALRPGDRVLTARGEARRLRWVGFGRTLVTPRNRDRASPVVVRRGALADGVPHRDLYLTRGHCLHVDGVLIPVEELINHRSIAWVAEARVVEFYHLELDAHDVLLAEGAPAESYRDADNSPLFHNAPTRPASPAAPPCAPLCRGADPEVVRAWRAIAARAGGAAAALTADPDLHLLADGVRLDAEAVRGGVWRFRLNRPVRDLRIVSRSTLPALDEGAADPRRLGVGLRRIVLAAGGRRWRIGWDDARLTAGFHAAAPAGRLRWTDGEAALPLALLAKLRAGATVSLHVAELRRYPAAEPARHLPEASPQRLGLEAPALLGEAALARLRRRGFARRRDPGLRCFADDRAALAPRRGAAGWLRLDLPAGTRRLRLASRQALPAETDPAGGDARRLGVAVAALRLDGVGVALDDPRLAAGWHAPEEGFRWTDGAALIDVAGAARVELCLAAIPLAYVVPAAGRALRRAA